MNKLIIIVMGVLSTMISSAQVNSRNGSFYVQYGDLSFDSSDWMVERVYNSFSVEKGIFGLGWGTNLETRLWVLPDGQLQVNYFGSGGIDLYLPPELDSRGIQLMLDSIVADETRRNRLKRSPADVIRRRAELLSDAAMRAKAFVKFQTGSTSPRYYDRKPDITRWVGEYRDLDTIVWRDGLYHLTESGRRYAFDRMGRLVWFTSKKEEISLRYNEVGLRAIFLNGQDSATVILDSTGKVSMIQRTDAEGKQYRAIYFYNSKGLLVRTVDKENNQYQYEYDRNDNMTFTRYINGGYRRMEYDPATNRTIGFRERNGDSTRYEYGYMYLPDGRINLDHYYTRTRRFDSIGRQAGENYLEEEYRVQEDGERYRYRVIEKKDSSVEEWVYPPNVGNVIYRRSNDREAWSRYDERRRPLYLRMGDSVFTTQYNLLGLPEQFQAIDSIKRDTVTYRYFFSEKGQLIRVVRNGIAYSIAGTVESGRVELTKGESKWVIGFKNTEPIYFIDSTSGRHDLSELNKPALAKWKESFLYILSMTNARKIEHEWIWDRF